MKPLSIFDRPSRRPSRLRRLVYWLDDNPGGISTLIVLAGFVVGMWSLFAFWQLLGRP